VQMEGRVGAGGPEGSTTSLDPAIRCDQPDGQRQGLPQAFWRFSIPEARSCPRSFGGSARSCRSRDRGVDGGRLQLDVSGGRPQVEGALERDRQAVAQLEAGLLECGDDPGAYLAKTTTDRVTAVPVPRWLSACSKDARPGPCANR
jgi:hypothetical protein